jgi:glyoxylase-like metal-dependent hydrolase (beta-lactamase superfamily II)
LKDRLRGRPRRIHRFVYGWEPVTEALSLKGGSPDRFLLEPVTGVGIEFDQGWALFDTGFNPETVRDPEKRVAHYSGLDPYSCYLACLPRGDPLVDGVRAAGLAWGDLAFCVISHLHCDHSGGLRLLVDGPPVVIQARERAFAEDEAGLEHAYFRSDYELPGLAWWEVDGEVELAPGVRTVPTYGHTPGHTSLAVELGATTVVLAGDAADLRRNIEGPVPCGSTTHPELVEHAAASIALLHELDSRPDHEVWPSHDPGFWNSGCASPELSP